MPLCSTRCLFAIPIIAFHCITITGFAISCITLLWWGVGLCKVPGAAVVPNFRRVLKYVLPLYF